RRDHRRPDQLWSRVSFVLDNSVAMRWCFDNATHPYAEAILGRLAQARTRWCRSSGSTRRARLSARTKPRHLALAAARAFIVELQSLDIRADEESATRILTDVHGLALTHGLTSYDAAYLEVALRRNLPLAT